MTRSGPTKRFILNRGKDISVTATFWVTEEAAVDSEQLVLKDPAGLREGSVLLFDDIELTVASVSQSGVTLTEKLPIKIPKDTLLSLSYTSKALVVAPGRSISRDQLEYSRRIRVPGDIVIPFASIVTLENYRYFVSGLQEGDSSLSVGLKAINETLDWYSDDPDFDLEISEEQEDLEDVIRWGTTTTEEPITNWPAGPAKKLRVSGIPAYQEQISLYGDQEEAGYIATLNRSYLIPGWYKISLGDQIKTASDTFRVTGIDPTRVRNMQALSVEYYRGDDIGA